MMKESPIIGCYGCWVILTYLSVVFAIIGMNYAMQGNLRVAIVCLMICGVCDMFDGSVARLVERTDKEKSYGVQIDALADIVSFGVFPAVIAYGIIINSPNQNSTQFGIIINIAILTLYILTALIRLAYFNVIEMELNDKKEKRKYYEGLPVTSVALIIPIVYAVCVQFNFPFFVVYNKVLLFISVAFVLRIRIPKIRLRYLVGLCLLIGLPILIFTLLSKNGVVK